ncbi:cation-transporting P-type ATPase [Oleomonas cavernae]|uniref:cation-transporting P-type ATPase n=1 Tax=Oleomonas cavernae TaxID=2320859 RepID=UPI0018F732AD|nr:cation-transporting P-type ATPase [Oleomonas cavernae]
MRHAEHPGPIRIRRRRARRRSPPGLSTAQAAAHLAQDGPNLAVVGLRRGLIAKLGKRLAEPLVAILLLAAADVILLASDLGVLAVALLLALTPLGAVVGFVALPPVILLAIAGVSLAYLACAEMLKHVAMAPRHRRTERAHRHV